MPAHRYLVGLVGAGVGPSLTPPMHMQEASALGIDYVYRTLDLATLGVAPEEIGTVLDWARRLGYDALNITHPCKQLVIPHLDTVDPVAAALGAVNTVLLGADGTTSGFNTDTTGFATAFRSTLDDAPRDHVVLLGAGGAGSAVGDALLRLAVRRLTVVDVDVTRAGALAADLGERHDAPVAAAATEKLSALLPDADGVVHCTPTGMADHPGLPFDAQLLHPGLWVADIVYRPLRTALLDAAEAAGCRTLDGGHMAVHQAVDAFALITGRTPDAARMSRHFRGLVGSDVA